jgi:DNA uptake protein ComE-like DNA-binding protein
MRLRFISFAAISAVVFFAAACSSNPTPDQLRKETAQDTATLKQDTQAVAEGIKEGLTNKKPVDLNKASKNELAALPGMDGRKADRVIAERPYTDKYQVVTRGALSNDEYAKIQDQISIAPQ